MIDILVIVPHEDDELAIAGPLIYAAAQKKQQLKIVFSTNGDYFPHEGPSRMREALDVGKLLGVPEEDIIFLGYGDQVSEDGCKHLYNSPGEAVVPSACGNTKTYGTEQKPEWCMAQHGVHHDYSRENLKGDIREIIETFLPRIIVTTGWDNHMDHLALSLFVDEIVADMMREGVTAVQQEDSLEEDVPYQPLVLKGLAYNGKWEGHKDYYRGENWTENVNLAIGTEQCYPLHMWEDRIRFAVPGECLTPRLRHNILYKAARIYRSQSVDFKAIQFINRDLVFWRKNTQSLTYRGEISASSGDAAFLQDGKCGDCSDITGDHWNLDRGIWRPEAGDGHPRITVTLADAAQVSQVWLYESVSAYGHLKKCRVNGVELAAESRHDGAVVLTMPDAFSKEAVPEIVIDLLEWEGNDFGLTEVEVYDGITSIEDYRLPLELLQDDANECGRATSLLGRWDECLLRFREFGRNRLWPYKYFLMKQNPNLKESDSAWKFWRAHLCFFFGKCWNNPVLRYIFFGGCTTLVNLVSYYILRKTTPLNLNIANWISIMLAILFAYVTNSIWVFESKVHGFVERLVEFGKFVGARAVTMVIEVGGLWMMTSLFHMNDFLGKFIIQFIVLVLNYVFSKFLVFTKKDKG